MLKLLLFNLGLVCLLALSLILAKKNVKTERGIQCLLLISPLLTILCHYSSFIWKLIFGIPVIEYLHSCPNLILPIYPCNVVMWCCLIYGLMKNKNSKAAAVLADYIYWFGILACLVGMFANVDFIRNPDFSNFEAVKSVVAHAFMFFNVIALRLFGKVKVSLPQNVLHIFISILGMYVIGLYCNLVFETLSGAETAWLVNSMFILHSPFDGLSFLTYPIIGAAALVFYFGLFWILELFAYPKGARWTSRIKPSAK